MNLANPLLSSLLDWMRILQYVEQYDSQSYTREQTLELNGSLEEPIRRATWVAQEIRRMPIEPSFAAELQRLADALVVLLVALRRLPGQTPPPRPEAGDLLRLLTGNILAWLRAEADVNLLRQLP